MVRRTRSSPLPLPDARSETPDAHPLIAGFRVGEPMGVGPLGTVYRAQHEETGVPVVFRGFSRPDDADPVGWERAKTQFRDLLTAHQRVDAHPNIQKIIGFGEDEGLFWIATEYFEGVTLQSVLTIRGAQSLPWALAVLAQVAEALDWAAERGLTHTDLTPFNILLVTPEGGDALQGGVPSAERIQVKVINFGLAHARSKYGSAYAAPEQMDAFEGDRQSDVYGAGALLYAILAGRPPFEAATPDAIARLVRTSPPTPLLTRPAYVQQVLAAMLATDPRRRYARVGEAIADLRNQRGPSGLSASTASSGTAGAGFTFGAPFPLATPPPPGGAAPPPMERTQDRFTRLELDGLGAEPTPRSDTGTPYIPGTLPPLTNPRSLRGNPAPTPTENANHIALQEYRLSAQDLVEVRARTERAKRETEDTQTDSRQRTMRFVRWGALAATVVLLAWHAALIPGSYRYATVIGETGEAFVRRGSSKTPLKIGDRFLLTPGDKEGEDNPAIVTGAGGRLLLDLPGARLHLREGTALAVRQAEYRGGPIRRFELERGSVVARVDPRHRGGAVFEIASAGVRAVVKGTFYAVARTGSGDGAARILVATREGSVRVVHGDDRAAVDAGHQLLIDPARDAALPDMGDQTDAVHDLLAHSQTAISGVPDRFALADVLAHAEENLCLPAVEGAETVAHLPSYISDRRAQIQAVGAMQALCLLAQTTAASDGHLPANVNLKTLSEFGLKPADNQRILAQFRDHRVGSYRTVGDDGFEFLAHANDTAHTLIRGRNGVATIVGNDDTDIGNTVPSPSTDRK